MPTTQNVQKDGARIILTAAGEETITVPPFRCVVVQAHSITGTATVSASVSERGDSPSYFEDWKYGATAVPKTAIANAPRQIRLTTTGAATLDITWSSKEATAAGGTWA